MSHLVTHGHVTMAEAVFLRELGHLPARPIAEPCEMIDVSVKVHTSETTATVFTVLVRVDKSLAQFRNELQDDARALKARTERRLRDEAGAR